MIPKQKPYTSQFHYPRRRPMRFVLRQLIRAAFFVLSDFRIIGRENLPISKPFGPFQAEGQGEVRRSQLEEIGAEIMKHIAELIPPERHGVFATDPQIRASAQEVAAYPYDRLNER